MVCGDGRCAKRPRTTLEHDPEKWGTGFPKRSCSNKKIERDDDSKKSHHALDTTLVLSFGRPGKLLLSGSTQGPSGEFPLNQQEATNENKLQMASRSSGRRPCRAHCGFLARRWHSRGPGQGNPGTDCRR